MTQITTQFNGIQRNVPGNSVQDGACNELINLRHKDGVLKPVGDKEHLYSVNPDLQNITSHSVGNSKFMIAYNAFSGYLVSWTTNPGASSNIANIGINKDIDIQVMGNFIIVIDGTLNKIYYFRNKEGVYKSITFPSLPALHFRNKIELFIKEDGTFDTDNYFNVWQELRSRFTDVAFAGLSDVEETQTMANAYEVCWNRWHDQNMTEGYVLIIYAIKLMNDTVVLHSSPQLIYLGNDGTGRYGTPAFDLSVHSVTTPYTDISMIGGGHYVYEGTYYTPGRLQFYIEQPDFNFDDFRDLVKGISIYVTYPEHFLRPPKDVDYYNLPDNYSTYFQYKSMVLKVNENSKIDEILKQPIFYELKHIPVDEISKYTKSGVITDASYTTIDFKIKDLKLSEVLPVNQYSHHSIYGDISYIYNSRLVFANITTYLFKGFSKEIFEPSDSGSLKYCFEVVLNTSDGEKIVRSDLFYIKPDTKLNPLLAYPDNRAVKMTLLYFNGSVWTISSVFKLKAHLFHNFSYCITSPDLTIENNNRIKPVISKAVISVESLSGPINTSIISSTVKDKNRVQISEVGNPFVFPAKNSYQVGISEAVDITSNSDPISQGQFGQYPLLVFCRDGVWALQISTGEAYISNISPFNGEILNRTGAIFNTGDYIVFIDSDYNVKIMAGREAIKISDPIFYNKDADLISLPNFKSATNHDQTCKIGISLSQSPGKDYIKGAIIGYNRDENEVIITNQSYPTYSYVYNVSSKQWYKSQNVYKAFINDYPRVLGVRIANDGYTTQCAIESINDEFFAINESYVSTPLNREIYLETMPLKFSIDALKQIDRLKLICEGETARGTYLSLLIYGSVDGIQYHYLAGKQATGKFANLLVQVKGLSCKYFKLIISGTVLANSSFTTVISDVEQKYGNKLR